jgi:carbon monoxide dehydrogenase subunit G
MFPVVVAVELDRPIDEVFAFVADLRNDDKWWPGVGRAVRLRGDGGVGTEYQQDTRLLGVRFPARMTVTEYVPPVRQVFHTDDSLTPFTAIYEFEELGPARTRFTMTARVDARGPFRVLGPIFAPMLRRLAARYFGRLRSAF